LPFITLGTFTVSTAAGVALGQYGSEGDAIEAALADALANGDRGPYTFCTEALDVKFLKGFSRPIAAPVTPIINVSQSIPNLLSLIAGATESVDFSTYVSGATFGASYSISASSGSIAALGLSFSGTTLSSSDLLPGTGVFQLVVSKSGSSFTSNLFTLTVPPALAIPTDTLPVATVSTAYVTTLSAAGGAAPYTWSITADTPDTGSWLAINASTGVLSGTPGTAEVESVTVRVVDAAGSTASKTFSLTVSGNALLSYLRAAGASTYILSGQQTDCYSSTPLDWINSSSGATFPGISVGVGSGQSASGYLPAIIAIMLDQNQPNGSQTRNLSAPNDPVSLANAILTAGSIPLFASNPQNPAGNGGNPWAIVGGGLAAVLTTGNAVQTTYLASLAANATLIKRLNGPCIYDFCGEMNLAGGLAYGNNWASLGHCTAAQYIALWILTFNYYKAQGATRMLWAYCPNDGVGNYTACYPGAGYVDLCGLDSFLSPGGTFGTGGGVSAFNTVAALGHPVFIASTGQSGSHSNWTVNTFTSICNVITGYSSGGQNYHACFGIVLWGQGSAYNQQNNAAQCLTTAPWVNNTNLRSFVGATAGGVAGG
jgi:hypothetical protein